MVCRKTNFPNIWFLANFEMVAYFDSSPTGSKKLVLIKFVNNIIREKILQTVKTSLDFGMIAA